METENQKWKMIKRLYGYTFKYKKRLGLGLLFGLLYGATSFGLLVALNLGLGIVTGEEIKAGGLAAIMPANGGNMSEISVKRVLLTVSFLPLFTILQQILFFSNKYLMEWVGNRVIADLRETLFSHVHSLPMQFFGKNKVGELITRITSDTGMLTYLVANVLAEAIQAPCVLIGSISAMFYLNWRLSVMALLIFPVCILPILFLGKRIRKASKRGQQNLGELISVVQESINGAEVVKAFQTEQEEINRFKGFNSTIFKMIMKQARSSSLNQPFVVSISSIGLAGIVVYAYITDLQVATLLTFAAAMVQMYKPAKQLSRVHLQIERARPGAERIFEILDIENTIEDRPNALLLGEEIQSVKFNEVGFAYDNNNVLENINLQSKAGQCVAFVGSSGAGKSTLVNLIPRFFDVTSGAILINGTDIRDYTVHSLRSKIGVVTQRTVLFNRSIRDNIAYGSDTATQKQIEDAAKRANAHDFIMKLEGGLGYETEIGERGSRLSGGMAQRIAIARALLRNPPILILDEATSALDNESERLVQGALNELMKDRTVFVIAHRLSTIIHSDLIVVMDKGEIVQRGTHTELLEQGGQYKYFHDMQFSKTG